MKPRGPFPRIVETLDKFGVRVPIIGDFHYNGHLLLKKYPEMARALAKYRINPGNVNIGKKHDDNFRTMIEAAIEYDRPVRIGVNWGSLDRRAAHAHDGRKQPARRAPGRADRDAAGHRGQRARIRQGRRALRPRPRPHHPQRQGQRRAGSDCASTACWPPNATTRCTSGLTEAGLGVEGHRGHHGRARGAAAGRHRRHHSRLAHAHAQRRPHRRGDRLPADSAIAGAAQLHAASDRLPRLRPHHQHVFPGHGRPDPDLSARADAGLERRATRASRR